jgi:hypothetical protein
MHATKRKAAWWSVVVEGETPAAYGPYRSEEAAYKVADRWNNRPHGDADDWAYVVPMETGPIDL